MATTVNLTSDFAGEAVNEIFTQTFLQANTLEKNAIRVIPNVVGLTTYLQKTTTSNGLADYTCTFQPTGDVNLDEKKVELKAIQLNEEICKSTFLERWSADQMGFGAPTGDIPANEKAALIKSYLGQITSSLERSIWNGVQATAGQFGGIYTELNGDVNANDVTGVALTPANIIAEMGKLLDATPVEVLQAPNFKFAMSKKAHQKYVRALGTAYFSQPANSFEGYEIEVLNGLTDNQMLTYDRDNLVFLTGLVGEQNELRTLDMSAITGDDTVRFIANFKAAATYVRSEDVTFYKV